MPQPLVWTKPKVTGAGNGPTPIARSGHSFTKLDKAYVLFGGYAGSAGGSEADKKSGKLPALRDVWTLRPGNTPNAAWVWTNLTCTGEPPLPRTNHAAVAIDRGQLLVFGGLYSSTQRLNDVHIFKIVNNTSGSWIQPKNQKPVTEPKNAESKIGAPEPRCNTSATYVKGHNKVYVFGGHGGVGYQRRAFNDLYSLDCENFEWIKIEHISGSPARPEMRGGHAAGNLPEGNKIFIYGGWSAITQYPNSFIYDADKNEWMEVDIPFDTPRWNMTSIMVPALPTWKFFIYGGSQGYFDEGADRNFGSFSDETLYLDIIPELKDTRFIPVALESTKSSTGVTEIVKPKARENTAVVYDNVEQRLIVFGGWANNWLSDLWVLNISSITGPDYALYDIHPTLGPYTGKTKVTLRGAQFKNTPNISVRFQYGKQMPEVPGIYVSETEITCETPSFEAIGAREADVRVMIDRGDPTLTCAKFKYFLNTKADKTISFGPGLLKKNKAGTSTMFIIQARNTNSENRKSGADTFLVKISHPATQEEKKVTEAGEEITEIVEYEHQLDSKDIDIEDLRNGQYKVSYIIPEPKDNVKVSVYVINEKDQEEITRGMPVTVSFIEEQKPEANEMAGPLMQEYFRTQLEQIERNQNKIREGLNLQNKNYEENIEDLLKIKRNIQKLNAIKEEYQLNLDIIEQALEKMESDGVGRPKEYEKCKKLNDELHKLEKMSTQTEKDIHPCVVRESEKTQEQIKNFEDELKRFLVDLKRKEVYQYSTGIEASMEILDKIDQQIQSFDERLKRKEKHSKRFEFPEATIQAAKVLEQIKIDKNAIMLLWEHIKNCNGLFEEYKSRSWVDLDAMTMADEVKVKTKELSTLKNVDKKCNTFVGISKDLRNWTNFLPLVFELKDDAMIVEDDRHWRKVKDYLQDDFELKDDTPLSLFWDHQIYDNKHKEMIEEYTEQAKQERKIQINLEKIKAKWSAVEFETIPLKLRDMELNTMKVNDEDLEVLEEHQLLIQNIAGSKFMAYFEEDVYRWQKGLANVNDGISALSEVQKTWRFLMNLFIYSDEVKKELPAESEAFVGIDKQVKALLEDAERKKNVEEWANQADVVNSGKNVIKFLEGIEEELTKCQKGLNDFIASKRRVFPRFYFLTMEELLDILANGNNPLMLFRDKNYMSKIVQAIDKLELRENQGGRPTAVSFKSCVGIEDVKFSSEVPLEGKVEIYLQVVLQEMITTITLLVKNAYQNRLSMDRVKFIDENKSQVILLTNMIYWVRSVEEAFVQLQAGTLEAMKNYYDKSVELLTDLIKMVQGELTKPMRQKVMTLITMDTHSRDMVEMLIKENVRKEDDFNWQKQLKMYWRDTNATINVADATIWYGSEYLGNGARLVVTPLTDRIYVTATQALHLKMGCAPAGPAGTGKTETTKDLASACGKACYVFNCSPEMDYISMGNTYKGLASSGSWGCFDEFNRLNPEVLSVCSVQFKQVTDAIKAHLERFVLEGDEIGLDPTCGAFITMNPGYLGRSELPEGLKVLFRPITVVVPDLELICENSLMAEGFVDAKILARKFVTLYKLCNDLLSKADHYDWGLRAIKSVLRVAGTFKRNEPEISEEKLLFRALRDSNYPKIAQVDLPIFNGLLGDLFPSVEIPRKADLNFENIIKEECIASGLTPDANFMLKVVQLGELLVIRHCVFIMGPPGAGKTTTYKTLSRANEKAGNKTTVQDLDPKTVSTKELYGFTNQTTKEWKNGLFSHYMQYFSEEMTDGGPKWIVLDGDLDANWIESMNSVMDDNKLLTLANNGRIVLKDYMRLIFEIRDLKFASPATVSRAGILYISDDSGSQRNSYSKSWVNKFTKDEALKSALNGLFEKYTEKTVDYLRKETKTLIVVSYFAMVVSLCKGLEQMLPNYLPSILAKDGQKMSVDMIKLESFFSFMAVWAFGGHLCEKDTRDYRKDFSSWWRNEWKPIKFPAKALIFDYYVDIVDNKAVFDEWKNKVPVLEYDTSQQMQSVTVPIPETVSLSELTKSFIFVAHPVMLIGNAGSGKTQMIKGLLKDIRVKKPDDFYYSIISCNYYTDSNYLQSMMESELVKQGNRYGPKKGSKIKLIYFVDDLNMPQLDPYDTQTSIAFLRQHVDYHHWYDITKPQPILKEIINTQIVTAMNPSAGSFFVNPRYQRHFWMATVILPDPTSLFTIFNTFLGGHFKKFKATVAEIGSGLIKASLQLHDRVVQTFRKTALNFHYEFNIRHIASIFQGMLMAAPAQFSDQEKIVKLWIHESERIYGDRLVSLEHVLAYKVAAADVVKKSFARFNMSRYFQAPGQGNEPPLVFCHFAQGYTGERFYDLMPGSDLKKIIEESLREYNERFVQMNLVLFEDAMKHVCRITRIVYSPGGHALLVGVGGSGKQSLTKLAAFICNFQTVSIKVSSSYSTTDLKADILNWYNKAGLKDEQFLFMMTDSHITNEKFLVYINDLLSSGEVAELYTEDDKQNIVNQVRPKVKAENKPDTQDDCWAWFVEKVKVNLHMALCFSPVGDLFRARARKFPGLVNCTVIDWFHKWPQQALLSVADQFLSEVDFGEDDKVREAVVKFMPYSFEIVNKMSEEIFNVERRYIYTTPKSFLELIKLFTNMLQTKRENLDNDKLNYERGLIKLEETESVVGKLEEDLKVKSVEVDEKAKSAEEVAKVVNTEKVKVEKESDKARQEEEECTEIKSTSERIQANCDEEVAKIQPKVDNALLIVEKININDFRNLKALTNALPGIDDTFYCLLFMFSGVPGFDDDIDIDPRSKLPKKVDWNACKKLMNNPQRLVDLLKKYPDQINQNLVPKQNFVKVKEVLAKEHMQDIERIGKMYAAAGSVLSFVVGMVEVYDAYMDLIPRRNALADANQKLADATEKLVKVKEFVAKLEAELSILVAKFNEANDSKNKALAEAESCQLRLSLANRLIKALSSEKVRWGNSIVRLGEDLKVIVGDVLLASSFVSYVGPFSKRFREKIITDNFLVYMQKNKIPMSPVCIPVNLLTTEAERASWNNQGLPSDIVSIENGTILVNSERYPLIIDPQLQGITWIREKEAPNGIKIMRVGQKNYLNILEKCLGDGTPVMFENLDDNIEAILNPIIARNFFKRGGKKYIQFQKDNVELSDQFRLYLQTKLSSPHYQPEIQAEAVLINFTVTEDGLGDQLLTLVVGKERPDLAKKKVELIQMQNEFKITLRKLEKELLDQLSNAQGDILANIELIENLERSKALSIEISEKVAVAKTTEVKINSASEEYRPAAVRGALIFFLLNELFRMSSFYMYSLESFVDVINRAIDIVAAEYAPKKKEANFTQESIEAGGQPEKPSTPVKTLEKKPTPIDGGAEGDKLLAEKKEPEEFSEKPAEREEPKPEKPGEESAGNEHKLAEEPPEAGAGDGHASAEKLDLQEEAKEEGNEEEAPAQEEVQELSPRSLKKRVEKLTESITYQAFSYVRRGLFERHKLIFSSVLTMRLLIKSKEIDPLEFVHLIQGKTLPNYPAFPETLKSYLSEQIFKDCKALEYIPQMADLVSSLEGDQLQWKKWFGEEKAEELDMPKHFKDITRFHKLMIIKAMRPDRIMYAMRNFVHHYRGESYIEQPPFVMTEVFKETSASTPIFFVLFPGTDPTKDVEELANLKGRKFHNISMGQGQEKYALDLLEKMALEGDWIMLQNVHLMESWLKDFERKLEEVIMTAKPTFRCFISSEPPPMPNKKIIPESILQKCVKISNEAPQDLKANLRRAYAQFSEERIEKSSKPNEFKSILYALCFFHSVVLGRRKFGSQGWARVYPFNDGDLNICADVLHNYLEKYEVVPYDDLKYIYGEIMYGGHITDGWDRRTCNTYLKVLIKPELLQACNLIPNSNPIYRILDPAKSKYDDYAKYIERLPSETPLLFGMHPNAEINYLTTQGETLFTSIIEIQGSASGSTGASSEGGVKTLVDLYKGALPEQYNILKIQDKIKEKLKDVPSPYEVVAMQECERMNDLLREILRSLEELDLGLAGALNMTEAMEKLGVSLSLNRVPDNWNKYWNKRPLASWYDDLKERCEQLHEWTKEIVMPKSICLSFLFNPMSFITAIMQVTARKSKLPLDSMVIQTDVTAMKDVAEIAGAPADGWFVHGFIMEGCDWEPAEGGGYVVDQRLKTLHPNLPIVNVVAVPVDKKITKGQYMCPVYYTTMRGPTYVFTANLNMESEESEESKWILAGVALILNEDL